MIVIIKGRQRQYKTTAAVGTVLELVLHHGFSVHDIVSNIHLFKPGKPSDDFAKFHIQGIETKTNQAKLMELWDFCQKSQVVELDTYHYLTNINMRKFMGNVVKNGLKHKIILIDEIDRVFSHRFWHDREQTESLLGLWQDEKLFNYIIGTAHIGKAIDTLIRESMQVEIITQSEQKGAAIRLNIINKLKVKRVTKFMVNIPLIQKLFYSWEAVV